MWKFCENNHNPKLTNSWIKMESQQHSNNMERPKKSMEKVTYSHPTSPPPQKKGLCWDTSNFQKRIFIYLFIYYPIEDKHERWGLGIGMCQFILISCGVL